MLQFVGKRYILRYSSGMEIAAHYRSERELTWEALAGPAKGSSGSEQFDACELKPGVFFVNWIEQGGTTVRQVLDLGSATVHSYVTLETQAGRRGQLSEGTLEEVPQR